MRFMILAMWEFFWKMMSFNSLFYSFSSRFFLVVMLSLASMPSLTSSPISSSRISDLFCCCSTTLFILLVSLSCYSKMDLLSSWRFFLSSTNFCSISSRLLAIWIVVGLFNESWDSLITLSFKGSFDFWFIAEGFLLPDFISFIRFWYSTPMLSTKFSPLRFPRDSYPISSVLSASFIPLRSSIFSGIDWTSLSKLLSFCWWLLLNFLLINLKT